MKTLIHNAIIVNENRRFNGYILIDGDFIAAVEAGTPDAATMHDADKSIDAHGAMLLPGAIDTHVHFREPGLTHKATIASESAAAVAGGVTSYLEMPNTKPAATSVDIVGLKKDIASKTSLANYGFFIGATNDNIDNLLAADYSSIPGIKLFLGSSTGNMLVNDADALESLFSKFKGVIAVHAEDEGVINANRQAIKEQYGDDAPVTFHSQMRSREACMKSSSFAVEIAHRHNSRLHLLHISTADELSLLEKGKIDGKRITAETCPHYLIFTDDDMSGSEGFRIKCNPAVKSHSDRDALREAVASGLIDVIATDHAPHTLDEKKGSLFTAASGMPGVKFMLPLMLDMTLEERSSLNVEDIVEKTAHNPARLYGIDRRGFLRPGYYADLVLVENIADNPHTITDSDAISHLDGSHPGCQWTPYCGKQLRHRIAMTFVNGNCVYDGEKTRMPSRAMELRFK